MDILELIKNRKTIRKYQDKPVAQELIDKIVEAGIWGPSVPSFLRIQPWRFVVITNKKVKKQISDIIIEKAKTIGTGVNILLSSAGRIIDSAPAAILVYNSHDLRKFENKYKEIYSKFSWIIERAELSAISAAIQNMIIAAEAFGVSSCWLDMPLYCREEINEFLKTKDELIAAMVLGYPAEEGRRSLRKPFEDTVKYIK